MAEVGKSIVPSTTSRAGEVDGVSCGPSCAGDGEGDIADASRKGKIVAQVLIQL